MFSGRNTVKKIIIITCGSNASKETLDFSIYFSMF